eukprot:2504405-Pleurochrysis_carterae.AAC.1
MEMAGDSGARSIPHTAELKSFSGPSEGRPVVKKASARLGLCPNAEKRPKNHIGSEAPQSRHDY